MNYCNALWFVELSDLSDCNEGIRLYSERADIFEGKLACFEDEKIELQDLKFYEFYGWNFSCRENNK